MVVTGFDHCDRIDLRAAVTPDNAHMRNHSFTFFCCHFTGDIFFRFVEMNHITHHPICVTIQTQLSRDLIV